MSEHDKKKKRTYSISLNPLLSYRYITYQKKETGSEINASSKFTAASYNMHT
jgi:hypothetical protein